MENGRAVARRTMNFSAPEVAAAQLSKRREWSNTSEDRGIPVEVNFHAQTVLCVWNFAVVLMYSYAEGTVTLVKGSVGLFLPQTRPFWQIVPEIALAVTVDLAHVAKMNETACSFLSACAGAEHVSTQEPLGATFDETTTMQTSKLWAEDEDMQASVKPMLLVFRNEQVLVNRK